MPIPIVKGCPCPWQGCEFQVSQGQKAAKLVQAFFKAALPILASPSQQRLPDARHRPSTSNSRLSGALSTSGRLHRSLPDVQGPSRNSSA